MKPRAEGLRNGEQKADDQGWKADGPPHTPGPVRRGIVAGLGHKAYVKKNKRSGLTGGRVFWYACANNGSSQAKPRARRWFVGGLGHTRDQGTGLTYMRARWYDPALGRFISEDPARDGANWFAYCRNNPVNAVDPTGMFMDSWQSAAFFLASAACFLLGVSLGGPIGVALLFAGGLLIVGGAVSTWNSMVEQFIESLSSQTNNRYFGLAGTAVALNDANNAMIALLLMEDTIS
jgi:RHS repeat-associated protein